MKNTELNQSIAHMKKKDNKISQKMREVYTF